MEEKSVVKGCIKSSRGAWKVKKTRKDGEIVTKLRYPTEKERQNNRQRERNRRSITQKIFAGLRLHGNYELPKHADTNDLLKALCYEAGWLVHHDGTLFKMINNKELLTSSTNSVYANIGSNDEQFHLSTKP